MPALNTLPERFKADQTAVNEAQDSVKESSNTSQITFGNLPEDIYSRILQYLLLATNVRQDPATDTHYTAKYHFDTAIMRVNRQMYRIGRSIFESNHFALLSTNISNLADAFGNHGCWIWQKKLAPFKHYHLRLHIKSRKFGSAQDKPVFFMGCLTQLDEVVRVLNIFELANSPQFIFKFEIKTTLVLSLQRSLLEPFMAIQGPYQKCLISGEIDEQLAKKVSSTMMPKVIWIRARSWTMYNIAMTLKTSGDGALAAGLYDVAIHCWGTVLLFLDTFIATATKVHKVEPFLDEAFEECCTTLDQKDTQKANEDFRASWKQFDDSAMCTVWKDMDIMMDWTLMRSVAIFALHDIERASLCYKTLRDNPGAGASLGVKNAAMYETAGNIIFGFMNGSKSSQNPKRHKQALAKLVKLLPAKPFSHTKVPTARHDDRLKFELHVLKELDYRGDWLDSMTENSVVQGFNPRTAETFAAARKQKLAAGGTIFLETAKREPEARDAPGTSGTGICMMPGPMGPRSLGVRSWWPSEDGSTTVYGPPRWTGRVAPPGFENGASLLAGLAHQSELGL